ncbi:hypothetical protein ACJX0J_029580, partial [Zea mays]
MEEEHFATHFKYSFLMLLHFLWLHFFKTEKGNIASRHYGKKTILDMELQTVIGHEREFLKIVGVQDTGDLWKSTTFSIFSFVQLFGSIVFFFFLKNGADFENFIEFYPQQITPTSVLKKKEYLFLSAVITVIQHNESEIVKLVRSIWWAEHGRSDVNGVDALNFL